MAIFVYGNFVSSKNSQTFWVGCPASFSFSSSSFFCLYCTFSRYTFSLLLFVPLYLHLLLHHLFLTPPLVSSALAPFPQYTFSYSCSSFFCASYTPWSFSCSFLTTFLAPVLIFSSASTFPLPPLLPPFRFRCSSHFSPCTPFFVPVPTIFPVSTPISAVPPPLPCLSSSLVPFWYNSCCYCYC